jgi:tetratricopeptide (TPR) repeat protein
VYCNSLHAPFLVDNHAIILGDGRIHSASLAHVRAIVTEQYTSMNTGLYRPFTTLTFLVDYAVLGHGDNPLGYHCLNLALHLLNVLLVYELGYAVLKQAPQAALLSAVWGLHPLQTEAVTNIVGRSDLLVAFCVLAGLGCHRWSLVALGWRRAVCLAAVGTLAGIGSFSKESGVVLAAVLFLYDLTSLERVPIRRRIVSYLIAALASAVYFYCRHAVLVGTPYQETAFCDNPLLGAGFWIARITALKVIVNYGRLMILPLHLSWDYSYNAIPLFSWKVLSIEDCTLLVAVAVFGALLVLGWRHLSKEVIFGGGWFLVTLLPASNLIILIGTIMAERLLYLPSVGFWMAVCFALGRLYQWQVNSVRWRFLLRVTALVWVFCLGCRTLVRNRDWADLGRLMLNGVQSRPGSFKTNISAAATILPITNGEAARAVQYVNRSLSVLAGLPDSWKPATAYYDAGNIYRNVGDRLEQSGAHAEARIWYQKSLESLLLAEKLELAWNKRYQDRNADRGMSGLASVPAKLYVNLAITYLRLGQPNEALASLERGHGYESSPELLDMLAALYHDLGHPRQAASVLVEALIINSTRGDLVAALERVYGQMDAGRCAVFHVGKTVRFDQACPLVHVDSCAAARRLIGNAHRWNHKVEAASIISLAKERFKCGSDLLN